MKIHLMMYVSLTNQILKTILQLRHYLVVTMKNGMEFPELLGLSLFLVRGVLYSVLDMLF